MRGTDDLWRVLSALGLGAISRGHVAVVGLGPGVVLTVDDGFKLDVSAAGRDPTENAEPVVRIQVGRLT